MKYLLLMICSALVFTGCATNKVEKRKQERAAAYTGFDPETKSSVDQRRIKIGMPMDAVYIAWGKPWKVLPGEGPTGTTTTWLYQGTSMEEYRYWRYRPYYSGYYGFQEPYLEHDYYPRRYVAAEVMFENGVVKSWRSLPAPR